MLFSSELGSQRVLDVGFQIDGCGGFAEGPAQRVPDISANNVATHGHESIPECKLKAIEGTGEFQNDKVPFSALILRGYDEAEHGVSNVRATMPQQRPGTVQAREVEREEVFDEEVLDGESATCGKFLRF